MPRIKLNDLPYYNNDQIANSLDADDIYNVYLAGVPEGGLSLSRRPGLSEFTDLGTGAQGDGIFDWEAAGLVVAVSGGNIYTLEEDGTVIDITDDALASGVPVSFAAGTKLDSTPVLYMANGKLVYSDNGGHTAYPSDVATPTTADQVVYINLRWLANEPGTNRFYMTDVNPSSGFIEFDYWSSADNPFVCESRGDNLIAMNVFNQEILNWGSQSMEVWYDDGATPFVPIPQAATPAGLEAKYSVVQADNTMLALCVIDDVRCVVKLSGRNPQVISEPIASILAGYSDVSDAIGQIVSVNGYHLYVLTFPTANATWSYDMKSNAWVPWGTWNLTTSSQDRFLGQHSCYVKAWNKHLIMSRTDGKIYEIDPDVYTDDGTLLKSYRRTIWEDHGILARKECTRLRIKIKRGTTTTGSVFYRYSDDGNEEWSEYEEIPLYPEGKRDFIVDLPRMGKYESRRYEFMITDDTELMIVYAEEDIRALRW